MLWIDICWLAWNWLKALIWLKSIWRLVIYPAGGEVDCHDYFILYELDKILSAHSCLLPLNWLTTSIVFCFILLGFQNFSLNNWCYFVVAGKSNFKSSISLSPTYFSLSHLQQFDLKTFYLLQKFLIRKLVFLQCQIPEKLETPTKHVSCKIINCCSHLLCLLYLLYFVYFILRDLDNIYQS